MFSALSFVLVLQLNACVPATSPNSSGALPSTAPASSATSPLPETQLFSKALSRRDLDPAAVNQDAAVPSAVPTPAPLAAPTAVPMAAPGAYGSGYGDISSVVSPYGYGYSSYFGGTFNQYEPLRAEELTYPGNASRNLQTVYDETVQPMLQEWDSAARLLETRGNTRPDQPERIYVPGVTDTMDSPREFKAYWIFRFASSPRKETLSIYINPQETLAYRTLYGEPDLALQKAQVSSERAIEIARAAFKDPETRVVSESSSSAWLPYPVPSRDPNFRVIYDLPTDLNWRTQLFQQGPRLVYSLSFDWQTTRKALGIPEIVVSPVPTAMPTPEPTALPSSPEDPNATPFPLVTPTPFAYCAGNADEVNRVYLSGSISIDAQTGAVLNISRPMYYDSGNNGSYGCAYGGAYSTGESYPLPSATADI